MEEKILTLHPQGKQGVNISRAKYNQMKNAILEVMEHSSPISFKELGNRIKEKLNGKFDGSITWYLVTVKQDLEARGLIQIIPNKTPQHLRLVTDI